jgi:predicted dinucleotide-binding enzyme
VVVDMVKVLVVELATKLLKLVVVATPFIVVVKLVPEVESALEDITLVVATTPLILVVKTFPITL